MVPVDDTIAAIATGPQGAERGIVRLSGPDAIRCAAGCFSDETEDWQTRTPAQVIAGTVRLDRTHEMPCELYLWPTHRSYTRQPMAELHTIGARPLLDRVVVQLCENGARPAQPGEFTLRAFLAGRLDLPQVEAVLGVIDSESNQQFQVAIGQLAGGLSGQLNQLRADLLDLCADLEAGLDFVEDDIEFVSNREIVERVQNASHAVRDMKRSMDTRTITGGTPSVAVIGVPNVGKSSLVNAICGDRVAIVSSQSGTTRDYVSRKIEVAGVVCELIDTAGRQSVPATHPAAMSQQVTNLQSERASFRLLCVDSTRRLQPMEQEWIRQRRPDRDILVATKCDRGSFLNHVDSDVVTSARTGEGIEKLKQELARRVEWDKQCVGETVSSTAVRCQGSLRLCGDSLDRAVELAKSRTGDELIAAELRMALDHLGQVVGVVYTDDILDRIFSRFCIGK